LAELAASVTLLADLLADFPPGQERLLPVAGELLGKLGEVVRLVDLNDPGAATTVSSIAKSVQGFAAGVGTGSALMFAGKA
jgi:hypothetical protein